MVTLPATPPRALPYGAATFHTARLLKALLQLDLPTRAALTRTVDLADEAALRGDLAIYTRVLTQQQDGEPITQIAATLAAERDRDDY